MTQVKFRAGNGKYFSKQLFWEQWIDLPIENRVIDAPYTLHRDVKDRINFGKRYVELRDPTGYKIAVELLENYNHWTTLMSCRWFVAAKEVWDREMDAAIKSKAMDEIVLLSKDGMPAQRLAAAKYLANAEYKKERAAKGRPRQTDIDRAARDMAASDRDVQEDLKRIQKQR